MKAYTDIEQSKKLAEILPLESADMCFNISVRKNMPPLMIPYSRFDEFFSISPTPDFLIPCWSLAALLDVLPSSMKDSIGMVYSLNMDKEYIEYSNPNISFPYSAYIHTCGNDNLVDACYDMIIKLHEQKLL